MHPKYINGIFCPNKSAKFNKDKNVPLYPCFAWVDGVSLCVCRRCWALHLFHAFNFTLMSLKIKGGIVHIGTYNDNSKEYHINREDLSSVLSELDSDSSSPAPDNRPEDILPIPGERKYTQVRTYIKERCQFDEEFKTFVQDHSLRDLCTRLTEEFGWFVDEHSLGSNLNRHRRD